MNGIVSDVDVGVDDADVGNVDIVCVVVGDVDVCVLNVDVDGTDINVDIFFNVVAFNGIGFVDVRDVHVSSVNVVGVDVDVPKCVGCADVGVVGIYIYIYIYIYCNFTCWSHQKLSLGSPFSVI